MLDKFHLDPDKVREVQICHRPPGRERMRVSVEYVTGETSVLTVDWSLLASVLKGLYVLEGRRGATRYRTL